MYRPGSYQPAFATAQAAAAKSLRTVAVLPFMNLTADNAAGYFCDGLAEELIDLAHPHRRLASGRADVELSIPRACRRTSATSASGSAPIC